MKTFRHIVLFRLNNEASDQQLQQAAVALTDLGVGHEGLESWEIHVSTDTRKGRIIIEEAVFVTEADYQRFRGSAKHVEVGDLMKTIADWWVGDYVG